MGLQAARKGCSWRALRHLFNAGMKISWFWIKTRQQMFVFKKTRSLSKSGERPNLHHSVAIFAQLLLMCSSLYTGTPPASQPPLPHANTAPSECCALSRDAWSTRNTAARETEVSRWAEKSPFWSQIWGFPHWLGFLRVRGTGTWSAFSHPRCSLQHPDRNLCRHFLPTEEEEGRGETQWKETKWKTNTQCKLFKHCQSPECFQRCQIGTVQ